MSDPPLRGIVNLLCKAAILIRKLQIGQFRSWAERGLGAVRMLARKPQIPPRLLRVAGHDTSSTARIELSLFCGRKRAPGKTILCCDISAIGFLRGPQSCLGN